MLTLATVVMHLEEGVRHEVKHPSGDCIRVLAADVEGVVVEINADCMRREVPGMRLEPIAKVVSIEFYALSVRERVRMGSFSDGVTQIKKDNSARPIIFKYNGGSWIGMYCCVGIIGRSWARDTYCCRQY